MELRHNISLKDKNTFGIDAEAALYAELEHEAQLAELAAYVPYKVMGGGSNILLTGNIPGLLVVNRLKGIEKWKEDEESVWLRAASGEVWHEFVLYTITHGWSGLENLSLIPGTVGAAPIQNIGAYGVEVKDVIESVTYWDINEQALHTLTNEACCFAYRDSIFKQELKGRFLVTSVCFRLSKKAHLNTTYGAIEDELQKMGVANATPKDVSDAVIHIRSSKLPDPRQIGNAGSFFKNPLVSLEHFLRLKNEYPGIPSYPVDDTQVKVPAGWLIEQCSWKGFRRADAGVHARQALVLVNYGHASGQEIWTLSGEVVASVMERFGIELEREVQVW